MVKLQTAEKPTPPEPDFSPDPRENWARSVTAAWLIDHRGQHLHGAALFEKLCLELLAEGIPLLRASCGLLAMHPTTFARSLYWRRGEAGASEEHAHGTQFSDAYRASPVALIHQGIEAVRRRLDLPEATIDFPVLQELKDNGATDYVCMPLRFLTGQTNYVSWATDQVGGFTVKQLGLLWDLLPIIALRLEILSSQRATKDLLTTYLGRNPMEQVLAGNLRPGQGSQLDAVLWYCDLRGFTALADRETPETTIATLDQYFDCMVRAVHRHHGEVLKFIGDAMLAIFPIETQSPEIAARQAFNAVTYAFSALDELNTERETQGAEALRVGIALHRGHVAYGNIGGADRLDFTAIGHAVNQVCRVEDICSKLGRPLLATASFQALALDAGLESVGFHALRGVREPVELFSFPYTGEI